MRALEPAARRRRTRREGVREGVTILAASVMACAAAAAALSLTGSADWESTAVVRGASADDAPPSAKVARRALDAAGAVGESASVLLDRLEVERVEGGATAFTVRASEPEAARRLAASYARAWAEARGRSAGAAGGVRGPAGPAADAREASARRTVVRAAGPPRQERATGRAALLGAAVGFLAGLLLALAREGVDVRRMSSRGVAGRLGFWELGRVPEMPEAVEDAYRLPPLDSPDGGAADAYAHVARRVAAGARATSARVIHVRGTVTDDRGEQAAAGLAVALAGEGRRVAVVELDQVRPALRRHFALRRGAGASEVARGEVALDEALAEVPGVSGLSVLTAGAGPGAGREATEELLGLLRERFDLVVVTGPPLLEAGRHSLRGAPAEPAGVNALVVSVALRRTRHSRRPRLDRVLRDLDLPVLGFVLVAPGAGQPRLGPSPSSAQRAAHLAAGGHQAGHHEREQR
jgi:Mrp family chromosome partitioning ATPase